MSEQNPNFTIITTGGCNAKCDFCTDPMNVNPSPNYISNLLSVVERLPAKFREVSISGGEPTISPDLETILTIVKFSHRFRKIVLSTNGTKLLDKLDIIASTVNHVNISRHAIGYENNVEIFKNKRIINDEDLTQACFELNKRGVDVNLNHVYTKEHDISIGYVSEYVNYAKSLGATSVTFRYDQEENSLAPTRLEMLFDDFKKVNKGGCPVCRNHTILFGGMPVVFKASFSEPSKAIGGVYELIYHPSATLTTDWGGTTEYHLSDVKILSRLMHVKQASSSTGGGCGNGGGCGR